MEQSGLVIVSLGIVLAVIVGVGITKEPMCLWGLTIIPWIVND